MGTLVRQLAEPHDHVQTHIRYSQPTAEDLAGRDYDDVGRIEIALLQDLLPDQTFDFYLCGPTPFMKSLFDGLVGWGIPPDRIHYEFFGPAAALMGRSQVSTPKRTAAAVECCEETEVFFAKAGVQAHWNASFDSLLDLAEANGLSPDYSCHAGVCQTCACSLEEGEVEYVLEPLEPSDPGSVLICCSKPKPGRVVLGL
jgi:ferredoxin-NADP reductase